ncbi:mitochondrial translation elongation factor Ts (EF-Ts) [Andalucia godoyi]|uniref:Elongation factor Ts, mitochondrial n=1 Tax=Andalucia godoyi TaxID=505711 RepID=A0A8K0AJT5_ANDGO|nr:mitochondrial translation elongation factor Ts (EF-Ts) [Andalucia godoyi]|eukprot:ANDGO_00844.mRNA.1 mitochondrial translation elongation factor Ts (EF-Ts)
MVFRVCRFLQSSTTASSGAQGTVLLKELRVRSGAGILDCKKALEACSNDMDAAFDWLRQKGIATATKKASRVASEGLVAAVTSADHSRASVVEVNSETDFVARNPEFQVLVSDLAKYTLDRQIKGDGLKADSVAQAKVVALVGKIGENLQIRRSAFVEAVQDGLVHAYVHNQIAPGSGLGQIGTLVSVAPSAGARVSKEDLRATANEMAMHITAMKPVYLTKEQVPAEVLEKEKELLREQAKETGKSGPHLDKIILGRLGRFYEEQCLLDQKFMIDAKKSVSQILKERNITLAGFERFARGEGIEKPKEDFAAEVQAQAKK